MMFRLKPFTSFQLLFSSVLLFLYAILVVQYLHNRSIWNDEAMLSLSIISRNFSGLLLPLEYNQVAPILFLQIEKLFTTIFGNSELALRLFPMVCAFCSLPLFYSFCLRFTNNKILSLCAMILLGCAPGFMYFSSEVKQYSTDVFVMLLLYSTAFVNSAFLAKWRWLALSIVGIIAVFLSNISVVSLFTLGLYFLFIAVKTKKISKDHLIPAIIWGIFFVINYMLFVHDHPYTQFMRDFWVNSFLPLNFWSPEFVTFVRRSTEKIFNDVLPSLPWGYLFVTSTILYVIGLIVFLRQKRYLSFYLCVFPVVIHLALSAFKLYPFDSRLVLYQAPLYIYTITYGLVHVVNNLFRNYRTRTAVLVMAVALMSFKIFLDYPLDRDEIKPALSYIDKMSKPGESLYVSWGASSATRYYLLTGVAKLNGLNIVWGTGSHLETTHWMEEYMKDLNAMKGRVWLLLSHMYPFTGRRDDEREIVRLLLKRGKILQREEYVGSFVYLFELK